MHTQHLRAMSAQDRSWYMSLSNWILGQLWVAKWMLGTNPGPFPEKPVPFTSELSVQLQKPQF